MELAKLGKDPLYKKYDRFRKLEKKFRAIIEKKYKTRAKAAALKAATITKTAKKK